MARMKKDGTPVKKPGPKTKPTIKLDGELVIETPEAHNVDIVETPETPDTELKKPVKKIVGPCHIDKYLITAINHPELGEFYYDKKFEKVDWRSPEGDKISMSPSGWHLLLKDMPDMLRILGV